MRNLKSDQNISFFPITSFSKGSTPPLDQFMARHVGYYRLDDAEYYFNKTMFEAYDLIANEGYTSFEAWMKVLDIPLSCMPELLELPENQCHSFVGKSKKSPPSESILKFCVSLGVHPAYLEPGIIYPDYSYHPNVIHAMTLMMKDASTPLLDRQDCLDAFKCEYKRYSDYAAKKPATMAFMRESVRFMVTAQHADLTNSQKEEINFKYPLGFHRSNLEEGMDIFGPVLAAKVRKGKVPFKKAAEQAAKTHIELIQLASEFFGAANADACLTAIIKSCEKICEDDKSTKETSLSFRAISEVLDINNEDIAFLAEENSLEFMDVYTRKEEFIYRLETHILDERRKHLSSKADFERNSRLLKAFESYKSNPLSMQQDIERFKTQLMIEPHIYGYSQKKLPASIHLKQN